MGVVVVAPTLVPEVGLAQSAVSGMAMAPLGLSLAGGVTGVVKVTAGEEVAVAPAAQLPVTVTEYVVLGIKPVRATGEAVPAWVRVVPPAGV